MLQNLIAPAIVSAIVSYGVAVFVHREKTRFSWLYQERAKAMLAIYARITGVERQVAASASLRQLEPSMQTSERMINSLSNIGTELRAFDNTYQPKRLLFSPKLAQRLDDMSSEYHRMLDAAYACIDHAWEGEVYNAINSIVTNPPDTKPLLGTVEREFRGIYGS
jgi:hypothetical protein